ncbi:DUF924 family protein [Amorphus orientalis]|uniref:Uncharacterized protein (DUF924 family) n=1 Tax=Amorphus orientalis TaxID=649198 RepID=A0AAE3VRV3_9HYPH|nr:DUF924 family protein [Amorphus orientalis]MDQ0317224.1 uncharacterized protein (DUF924 family) [Amorphus orientalis]
MSQTAPSADAFDLLAFWWDAGPAAWFSGGQDFDSACARFRSLRDRAARGDLDHWAETPHGALALLLLLDQLPRNLFRDQAEAFATDGKALDVAEAAIAKGFDRAYPMPARNFFYLPFMHSEELAVQERSLDLYRTVGDQDVYFYALVHYDAIRRFGRFPHRNPCLGRTTTEAERAYLDSGGFSA